jgi:hypothetical protein
MPGTYHADFLNPLLMGGETYVPTLTDANGYV